MYKYRHFPIVFGLAGLFLISFFFAVSFDNNDDQYMYFISSGVLSGIPSPHILLSHVFIGKMLKQLSLCSRQINWYTLYLQCAFFLSMLSVFLCVQQRVTTFTERIGWIIFLVMGIGAICLIKLQFTTVALFCALSALLCLQSLPTKCAGLLAFVLISISILMRKESFYIFLLFGCLLLLKRDNQRRILTALAYASIFFFSARFVNGQEEDYRKYDTYAHLEAFDIIAARPVKYDPVTLAKNNFTTNDIVLLQNWFPADPVYLSGSAIKTVAHDVKSKRGAGETIALLRKLVKDERYILLLYALSLFAATFLSKRKPFLPWLYFVAGTCLFVYLAITLRLPHRVAFPVIAFLCMYNFLFFIESYGQPIYKKGFLLLLLLISAYKFYCVASTSSDNKAYHRMFEMCEQEVTAHPTTLFIAVYDGFPVQLMNAYRAPDKLFTSHNLILTCWYAYSPDFKKLLKLHGLANLTSDVRGRKDILFLTDSKEFQNAYQDVIKQRYHLNAHFEEVKGYRTIHPKALVFDQDSTAL